MLLQTVFMGGLISYFRFGSDVPKQSAYLFALAVTLCSMLFGIVHHPYFYGIQKIGMRLKIAAMTLIFRKVTKEHQNTLGCFHAFQ